MGTRVLIFFYIFLTILFLAAERADAVIKGDGGVGIFAVKEALDALHNQVARGVIDAWQIQSKAGVRSLFCISATRVRWVLIKAVINSM